MVKIDKRAAVARWVRGESAARWVHEVSAVNAEAVATHGSGVLGLRDMLLDAKVYHKKERYTVSSIISSRIIKCACFDTIMRPFT